jgi:hypothetical protein
MATEGNGGHRKAFMVGTALGAAAGAGAAIWNAPRSGRATRDSIQQSIEGVLFKALDMRPWQKDAGAVTSVGVDTAPAVTLASPEAPLEPMPADIVLDGPRPVDAHV